MTSEAKAWSDEWIDTQITNTSGTTVAAGLRAVFRAGVAKAMEEAHAPCCDCCFPAGCDGGCGYKGHPNFVDGRCTALRAKFVEIVNE